MKLRTLFLLGALLLLLGGIAAPTFAQVSMTEIDAPLNQVTFPEDWIGIQSVVSHPELTAPGYFYYDVEVVAFGPDQSTTRSYLIVMDNEGDVRFFERSKDENWAANFTPFDDHGLVGFDLEGGLIGDEYVLVDTNYVPFDTIYSPQLDEHEYRIDTHSFQIDDDGTYWITSHYDSLIDMSQYFEGAPSEFDLAGHAIIHIDTDGETVLWSWKSMDYLDELPLADNNNTNQFINGTAAEHIHTNAIEIDTDGNLLVSNRTVSTVAKVRYNPGGEDDGDVLWELGGGAGNVFTFADVGPDSAFDTQHDARRLPNGNITVYDNGTGFGDSSAAKEFSINEETLAAELVWAYYPPNALSKYSMATGSTRRLDNGNTLVCWGWGTDISFTEVTQDCTVAFELVHATPPGSFFAPFLYRAFKSDYLMKPIMPSVVPIRDTTSVILTMNFFEHTDVDSYFVELAEGDGEFVELGGSDSAKVKLTGLNDATTYRVRVKAKLTNETVSPYSHVRTFTTYQISGVDKRIVSLPTDFKLGNAYPNPFNPTTMIPLHLNAAEKVNVTVYDISGRLVATLHQGVLNAGEHRFNFNGRGLASGVYFLRASTAHGKVQTQRLVLVR